MITQFAQWFQVHSTTIMMLGSVVIAVAAYLPGRKSRMEQYAQIPLRDDR